MARPPSRSELRRQLAAARTPAPPPDRLDEQLETYMAEYEPRGISPEAWQSIQPVMIDWMRRYGSAPVEASRNRIIAIIVFLDWAHKADWNLTTDLLTPKHIDGFTQTFDASKSTRANYRSRLRGLGRKLNPETFDTQVSVPLEHKSVDAPYSAPELAEIIQFAHTQPTAILRRQTCATISLGLGAGLDSLDLRLLERRHIEDLADQGIMVNVPGRRSRTVWVRASFEDMLRDGIIGLRPDALVIGEVADRRNITGNLYRRAEADAKIVHIQQSRLRTTWLAALLSAHVPLVTVMQAAGLTSARTLTELVPHLDVAGDVADLREVR